MSKLVLNKVNKIFDKTHVIKDVSMTIEDGEFVVFVGPSGCGKSTLLRLIAGLEDITDGTLMFDGDDVTGFTPSERGIGMVFQSYALYPHMTVEENIAFGLKQNKVDPAIIAQRVQAAAESLELSHLMDRKPKALSGGQRQRVAIGRAIVKEPRVFLFDEPLSNLDAKLRVQMRMEIAKLHERLKSTMIYVTHDQVEAMTLADKIVVLHDGRVSQIGTPMELYNNPKNQFVASFIGSPQMNFIDAEVISGGLESSIIKLQDGSQIEVSVNASSLLQGTKVVFGVRPEHLSFVDSQQQALFSGEVTVVENLGNETLVYMQTEFSSELIVVRALGDFNYGRGDKVHVASEACHYHVFCNEMSLPRTSFSPASVSSNAQ